MKNSILNALFCSLAFLSVAVYAQDGGPCSQCYLIGSSDAVLMPCSQMWRDIVDRCSSTPDCRRFNIDDNLIKTCTNTPLPVSPGTGTTTFTAPFDSPTTASATTTRSTTTSASTNTSASATTSASSPTSASVTTSLTSGRSTTRTTTYSPSETTTGSSTLTTSAPAGTFSQAANMAVGNVPRWWVEGFVLVVGWVFAL